MWKDDDRKGIVYSIPRQAPLLNCFCIAQFPPDGKLDGKINETQGRKTSERQQQDTDVVV